MNLVRNRFTAGAALGVAVVALSGAAAHAGMTHPLEIQLWTGGEMVWGGTPSGTPDSNGPSYHYEGEATGQDWGLEWDIEGDADPFVIANTVIFADSKHRRRPEEEASQP